MITKTFEIRDASTFIPALAVKLDPGNDKDRYLLLRAGYGTPGDYIFLAMIDGGNGRSSSDPYDWPGGARTMRVAHQYIAEHFDDLKSGDVVCVEFILGERTEPKESEHRTQGGL